MSAFINKKSALDATPNADLHISNRLYFKPRDKKIQLNFPKKASPLFCSFDYLIAKYINKIGYCYYLQNQQYLTYDLAFSSGKEVWVFYFREYFRQLSLNFSYELLRHGAIKVLVIWFPLEECHHGQ